jgi:hypothetical protein
MEKGFREKSKGGAGRGGNGGAERSGDLGIFEETRAFGSGLRLSASDCTILGQPDPSTSPHLPLAASI